MSPNYLLIPITALAVSSCSTQKESKEKAQKPMNIIYIMSDDHSYQTISAYDKRFINTPNIDRIANEGVRFFKVTHSLSNSGSFKVAYRMFPKHEALPHRQDFCYVRWFNKD